MTEIDNIDRLGESSNNKIFNLCVIGNPLISLILSRQTLLNSFDLYKHLDFH